VLPILFVVSFAGQFASTLEELASGKHAFSKTLAAAKRPMIVLGSAALQRADGDGLFNLCNKIAAQTNAEAGWSVFNLLQRNASQVAALDIGYRPSAASATPGKFVYLLNADETTADKLQGIFQIRRPLVQQSFLSLISVEFIPF
jgi:NADH dehydrogenase (ubiquinone) Fe-S protein 1